MAGPKSPLQSSPSGPLSGVAVVPGDKSISHRALILGALAVGETRITGLLESDDVLATAAALRALGAQVRREDDGDWRIFGCGVGGLSEPSGVLDMGNSGTAVRLLMGVSATLSFNTTFCGDASLSKRPMERVMTPLRQMGAQFTARDGGRLPITVSGARAPIPITYALPVASAQVKTAILLAGLNTPGLTTVIEPEPTRDHSERMLGHFGAEVTVEDTADGGRRITLSGQPELTGHGVTVPGDFSSAAFPMVAALLAPRSRVTLTTVGINPLRTGLLETLLEMGASIGVENRRTLGGEAVADLVIESSSLKGITVPGARAPSMIDEYPVLAVAAAFADGETRLEGLAELRVKESDRLAAMARGLAQAGVDVTETEDSLTIRGGASKPRGGVHIEADLDHRIAMAFLVLGAATQQPISIDDAATMDSSFPGFAALMNGLGANIAPGNGA
ncbi:MAG: 3-phosphoshikimate 1-carboxyvinyltransferase [Proteobacteria bacterium]|nr:3-phosphoshikimate 1-carboxyvinyltransferase [Pseudomonadota bacterium]